MYTMVISGGSGDWGFGGDLSGRQISYIRARAVDSEITTLPAGAARENSNGVTTRLSGSSPGVCYSAGRWLAAYLHVLKLPRLADSAVGRYGLLSRRPACLGVVSG